MNKKRRLFVMTGAPAMVLVFGFVLFAGCPTGSDGGGEYTVTAEQAAAQLAADLNALEAGSATVTGAKVSLTGEVNLAAALTVPAGVTLDLSGGSAKLVLKNGAALTVDGTVDAKAEGVNVDGEAATAAVVTAAGNSAVYASKLQALRTAKRTVRGAPGAPKGPSLGTAQERGRPTGAVV